MSTLSATTTATTIPPAPMVTPASTNTPAQTALQPSALGESSFLQLLVAQLKNQDPLNPQDSTAFVAELAQFSQLEQTSNQSGILQKGLDAQNASLQYSLVPLIGRTVSVQSPMIQLGTTPATLNYSLGQDAASVSLSILNAAGQVVRTGTLGAQSAGAQQVTWDGTDQNGTTMSPGTYTYAITALNAQGQAVPVTTTSQLTVTGIQLVGGQPQLTVGNQTIAPSTVIAYQ